MLRWAKKFPVKKDATIPAMADAVWTPAAETVAPRHGFAVRATHWITVLCFLALLLTGGEILLSHPRFYWGESGNVLTRPLFQLPVPSSRATVPTGYDYVLPDQNGWSRELHFQTAWVLGLTGLVYLIYGIASRHFSDALAPTSTERSWRALSQVITRPAREQDLQRYNPLQKVTYLVVIFALFPLVIWTGLAMSPAFVSVFPASAILLGGQQSARTIHFFVSVMLVLFLVVHVAMVYRGGFRARMRGMITGRNR
jgi:thiosulfate reductase cytochrome b subunit